jgi:ATP-binding cassette subfamily C protein
MPLQGALGLRKLYLSQAQVALAFLEEVKIDSKIEDRSNNRNAKRNEEIVLAATNVSFVHPSSQAPVLKKLNIEIKSNTLNALIGPSGTGKTTLFELFLGMLSPTSGSIEIEGLPPKEFIMKYPGKVGYVPQQPALVKGTILENIALGLNTEDVNISRLNSSIDRAGLRQFLDSLPDGLKTNIGESAHLLSGGQRQRIGLARALYSQPRYLLLDEATSALDAESEAAISNTIRMLRSEMTIVLIAHRLTTVQDADMVFAMNDGEIIGKGKFRDIVKEVPMVSNYVKLGRIRTS